MKIAHLPLDVVKSFTVESLYHIFREHNLAVVVHITRDTTREAGNPCADWPASMGIPRLPLGSSGLKDMLRLADRALHLVTSVFLIWRVLKTPGKHTTRAWLFAIFDGVTRPTSSMSRRSHPKECLSDPCFSGLSIRPIRIYWHDKRSHIRSRREDGPFSSYSGYNTSTILDGRPEGYPVHPQGILLPQSHHRYISCDPPVSR